MTRRLQPDEVMPKPCSTTESLSKYRTNSSAPPKNSQWMILFSRLRERCRFFSFAPMLAGRQTHPSGRHARRWQDCTIANWQPGCHAEQAVRVITTDTVRAGGFAQLEAFTKF